MFWVKALSCFVLFVMWAKPCLMFVLSYMRYPSLLSFSMIVIGAVFIVITSIPTTVNVIKTIKMKDI